MNVIRLIVGELVGLFLDDAFMAIAILALIAISAWLAFVVHATSLVLGVILLLGCISVLVISTLRGMRR
jgi:hypothetical protein